MPSSKLNSVKGALSFLLALCVAQLGFVAYLAHDRASDAVAASQMAALFSLLALGIWLRMQALRYVGGSALLLYAGLCLWPALRAISLPTNFSMVWVALLGVLSLITSLLLLFSRAVSLEFKAKEQPQWQLWLKRILAVIFITALTFITVRDLVLL